MSLRWADSRFAEPQSSLRRERIYSFRVYEKNQKYTRGLRTSGLRGRFKSPVDMRFLLKCPADIREPVLRKAATSPGIAGNDLNRCDAPALQHKIRAKSKRTAAFFANSRLRGVEMGSGGWKRVVLDSNKERFVRKKGFWFVKKTNFFSLCKANRKRKAYSAY